MNSSETLSVSSESVLPSLSESSFSLPISETIEQSVTQSVTPSVTQIDHVTNTPTFVTKGPTQTNLTEGGLALTIVFSILGGVTVFLLIFAIFKRKN